ncbi:hypothetical protein HPB50_018853 [Hyalomma asiaticum]|uniref:Uncharacterized protein n=1 Tax=Hyalomma asiaticum TaxID=266040 RepID=A0ACB7S0L8_HYAAI|nr:hypothetical protein HPB50_018853 [Hyalomma asiaticum]
MGIYGFTVFQEEYEHDHYHHNCTRSSRWGVHSDQKKNETFVGADASVPFSARLPTSAVSNMSKSPLDDTSSTGSGKRQLFGSTKKEADGKTPSLTSTGQTEEATVGPATTQAETGTCRDSPGRGNRKARRRSRSASVSSIPTVTAADGKAKRRASDDVQGRPTTPSGSKASFRQHQPPRKPSLSVSSSDQTLRRASKTGVKDVSETTSKTDVKDVSEVAATGQTLREASKAEVKVVAPEEKNVPTMTLQPSTCVTPVSEVVRQAPGSEVSTCPRLVTFAVAADAPRSQEDLTESAPQRGSSPTAPSSRPPEKVGTAEPSETLGSIASVATTTTLPEPRRAMSTTSRESNATKPSAFLTGDSGEFSVDNRAESPPAGASSVISSAPESTRSGREDSSRASRSLRDSRKPAVLATRDQKAVFDFTNILLSPPKRPSKPAREKEHYRAAIAIAVAVFLATLFTVAILVYSFVARDKAEKRVPLCSSEDCTVHADILTAALNRSLDPCDDFRAYVCSAWSPPRNYREHVTSVMDDVIVSHLEGLSAVLREGSAVLRAGEKARRMYELCEQYFDDGGANVKRLSFILKYIGLSWPEEPEDYKALSFFDLLMELSLKWQLPFWISVSVLSRPDFSRGRLLIKPGDYVAVARNHHRRVIMDGDYAKYLQGFYGTLSEDDSAHAEAFFIEESKAVEGDVLEQLYSCLVSSTKNPASFPLSDIGNFTANVPSADWEGALRKYLYINPSITREDRVLVSDTKLLETVDRLLDKYDKRQLRRHLAWLSVQMFAPVFDSGLLWFTYGGKSRASPYRPVFCGLHVEAVYKLLMLCLTTVSRLSRDDEKLIDSAFATLVSTAVHMVNGSEWLDRESKDLAMRKLSSLRVRVWPPSEYMDNEVLEERYKEYPRGSETFREYWVSARRLMSERVRAQEVNDADSLPSNYIPAHVDYDYILNSIELPVGIIQRPIYYASGTEAMFYGGLGFLMAKEMVKALDGVGLRWDPDGNQVESILSRASTGEFRFKDSCLRSQGSASIFPEVPALEIAHSSLLVALKDQSVPLSIRKDLPEVVVFFMTLCYVTCATEGFPNPFAADCNKAVRNSAAFASAFKCTVGTRMNPGSKCGFFES